MTNNFPWYHKASRLQLVLIGAVAVILIMNLLDAVFKPEEALLRYNILMTQNWDGLRIYAVIAEFFGEALVGALAGWLVFGYLRKKRQNLRH